LAAAQGKQEIIKQVTVESTNDRFQHGVCFLLQDVFASHCFIFPF